MAFPVPIARYLSGATPRQLGYWRRSTRSAPPLIEPTARRSGRYLYSWADVVALRAIVYLRQEKSLPKIRTAVGTLRELEAAEWEHLSQYRLERTAETIVVQTPSGEILDLERAPGTVLESILMDDVLGPFDVEDREVPSLRQPRPLLTVDPRILGGYPVVAGSRVPFDSVAALADEGAEEAEIIELYPSVNPAAIPDALDFARHVAQVVA
jgi:uncharacterized protein (DUF433 family)/DNA-binding transcriptional MerR regulator